jgi:hypothetical protein
MPEFPDYRSALSYCVAELIPRRHKYIVDILGEREAAAGKATTLQVIAQHLAKDDGVAELAMHLPIDLDLPDAAAWRQYLEEQFAGMFERLRIGPIGSTLIRLGNDADKASRLIEFVLTQTFRYPADAKYYCYVHDEGPIAEA